MELDYVSKLEIATRLSVGVRIKFEFDCKRLSRFLDGTVEILKGSNAMLNVHGMVASGTKIGNWSLRASCYPSLTEPDT